jgi:hypothetical protein
MGGKSMTSCGSPCPPYCRHNAPLVHHPYQGLPLKN